MPWFNFNKKRPKQYAPIKILTYKGIIKQARYSPACGGSFFVPGNVWFDITYWSPEPGYEEHSILPFSIKNLKEELEELSNVSPEK